MRLKFGFLLVLWAIGSIISQASAQSARNPLNLEGISIRIQNGLSGKELQSMTFFRPDGTPFDRTVFKHGEDGKMMAEVNQTYDKKLGAWNDMTKNDFTYRNGMKSVISASLSEYATDALWMDETNYDALGRKSSIFYYSWKGSIDAQKREPYMKGEWKYDEKGYMTEFLTTNRVERATTWDYPVKRILYAYDAKGRLTEEVMQAWYKESAEWKNQGKYTYVYNDNTGEVVAFSWYAYGDEWKNDCKIVCSYDDDGDMIRCDYYDSDQPEAPLNAYCTYAYTKVFPEVAAADSEISVYPNPAVSYFELVVPEKYLGKTAFLYDTSGRQTKAVVINNATMQVDVSGLAKGFYFLKVDAYTKKIRIN